MAETSTPRFGLKQWSVGTDSPSRLDFNESLLNIENRGLLGSAGTLSARPAAIASNARTIYLATDTAEFFWSTGSSWVSLGSVARDALHVASAANKVPLTIKGFAGQSTFLLNVTSSADQSFVTVDKDGNLIGGSFFAKAKADGGAAVGITVDAAFNITSLSPSMVALKVKATAGQTADLVQWLNSADTIVAKVDASGVATFPRVSVSAAPAANTDLTNKGYVDQSISNLSTVYSLLGHKHAASDVISGTLDISRLPVLPASQTTSGVFDIARIPQTEPAGVVKMYGGLNAPSGYLFCEGQSLSRTTYAALFAAIGTIFGSVDGTTFNLPDLRSRVPVGYDTRVTDFNAMGKANGYKDHTLTWGQMPYHQHDGQTGGMTTNAVIPMRPELTPGGSFINGRPPASGGGGSVSYELPGLNHGHFFTTNPAGNNEAHNNMQPYLIMKYIIKT